MKLTTDSVDVRVTVLSGGGFEICPESDVTLLALRAAARAEGRGPSFREAIQIPELLSDESKTKIAQWAKRKPIPRTDGTIVMARPELFALYGLSGAVPSMHKRSRRPEGVAIPAAVSVVAAVPGQPLAPVDDFEAGSGLALRSGPDFSFDIGICDDIEPAALTPVPTGERFRKVGRFGDNGGRLRVLRASDIETIPSAIDALEIPPFADEDEQAEAAAAAQEAERVAARVAAAKAEAEVKAKRAAARKAAKAGGKALLPPPRVGAIIRL